jgi:membrane protease YdiL (CAAX protease family)
VWEIIPLSETPFILLLVVISLRLHRQGWESIGFKQPQSWGKTISVGLLVSLGLQLTSLVTDPIIATITGSPADLTQFEEITGNSSLLLIYLGLIWTLAAFGEEIAYRGFIVTRISDLFGSTKTSGIVAVGLSSVLFAIGHYYKGPAGMIDSGIGGLIYGSLYLLSGRNLWLSIFVHGFADTLGLLYFYFGLNQ